MGVRKLLIILLLFLSHSIAVLASNQVYFDQISIHDGLSNGWVRCFYQDRYDFTWVGTSDGLNRFDGNEFKVYRPILEDGSYQGNFTVNFVTAKNNDTLWVGTDSGLYAYSYLSDEFKLSKIALRQIPILSYAIDLSGRHWFGSNTGVYMVNQNNEIEKSYEFSPNQSNTINDNYINTIHVDKKNNIWLGTKNGLSLYLPDTDSFMQFHADGNKGSLSGNDITAITEDNSGNIWLGISINGVNLIEYKNNSYSFIPITDGAVIDLLVDSDNLLWIGHGAGGGITRINLNNFSPDNFQTEQLIFNPFDPRTISDNSIVCLYEDKFNDIWVGTFSKGISFHSKWAKKIEVVQEMYGSTQSIGNNMVNGFLDDEDYLWIATEGGLDRLDKKTGLFKHYQNIPNDPYSLASNSIFSLFKDSRDNLWIGTWSGGLHRYDRENDRFKRFLPDEKPGSISNINIFSINEDKEGNLLVTTNGGGFNILDYKTETFSVFQHNNDDTCSISDNSMDNVYVTKRGEIIIGLYSLANRFNKDENCFEVIDIKPQNSEDIITGNIITIFEDSNENLWFGTSTGLIKYNLETNKSLEYTVKNGLPSNTILSIEEDNNGNLWMGTGLGLTMFVQGANSPETIKFHNFDSNDGLPSNDLKKR